MTRITLKLAAMAFFASALILAGCEDNQSTKKKSMVDRVAEDIAGNVAENVVESSMVKAVKEPRDTSLLLDVGEKRELAFDESLAVFGISDMVIHDSVLIATYDGGVIRYDFREAKPDFTYNDEIFSAVAYHGGKAYVGGERLYYLSGAGLVPEPVDVKGNITALYSDSRQLLIGTDEGLYRRNEFGNELILDDVAITSLVFDRDGLWVGTDGQGLFRWDGDQFRKRYLARDTAIFDHVYDLDYNHGYLYVAAATGFFTFDGGRWTQWTTEDGLPSNNVRTIDASDWVVLIGTDAGMISWFRNNLLPLRKLENVSAGVIRRFAGKVVVGTEQEGILIKSRHMVKTLVEPIRPEAPASYSLAAE